MSEYETQRQYLHRQIQDRLTQLNLSIQYYRSRHYKYQYAGILLSVLITLVSGLKLTVLQSDLGSNILLILGTIATVVATLGTFFSPQQSWHLTADIYGRLRALKATLEFSERASDFDKNENMILEKVFNEYQKILIDYNKKWQDLRHKSK
ncbi:SLATT domain-containing protein [Acinetobacter sp. ANC 4193]